MTDAGQLTAMLIRKLDLRDSLSGAERQTLEQSVSQERIVEKEAEIVSEGTRPAVSTLLVAGFAGRYRSLRSGGRQITAIHIAGDFIDLHSFLLKKMDHGVVALTDCKVALVTHDRLEAITNEHPHLTRMLWLSTVIDAAIHREWIAAMGRRNAVERLAHLICELYLRLEFVGLARDGQFSLPLSQSILGDVLGLSVVHVNRCVRELRGAGLATIDKQVVSVLDFPGLAALADFDPAYLNFVRERR